tara:strand:+ start:711 stop:1013 length:303 start_codon:yes stop_codon:yes gene_type:complete
METENNMPDWVKGLSIEDLNFLRRFLLQSGSLKKVAAEYHVSYPTVRLRLDRLIQKVEIIEEAASLSPFEQTLRVLLADQAIDPASYQTILKAHQTQTEA